MRNAAAATLIAGLALGLLCGCDENAISPDGGPDDPVDLASPIDGYVSPRRDGLGAGIVDLATVAQGVSPDLAGKSGVDEAVCDDCEKQQCRNVDGNDWYAFCFLDTDMVTDGPGAGQPWAQLCLETLRCARRTGCAAIDPQACYCGDGVSDSVCLAQPAGPCRAEFEAAAETTHVDEVVTRLQDPSFPVGAAFNLLRYCEVPICGASCTGGVVATDGGIKPDLATLPDLAHGAVDLGGAIPCADLDQDGRSDCDETLVHNARFDADVSSWRAEYGASASWEAAPDALGGSPSGSIVVGNTNVITASGTSMTGASQCVTAGVATYLVAAHVRVAAAQGAGAAALAVQFFGSADCSGSAVGVWTSPQTSAPGAWTVLSGLVAAPAATQSLRVRLVALKPFSAPAFQAHFDNVLLAKP